MSQYYKNQTLTVQYTDTGGEDLSALILAVNYWAPTNSDEDTPTGTIGNASITKSVGGDISTVEWTFTINTLNASSTTCPWRVQLTEPSTAIAWPPINITVNPLGGVVACS